VGDRFQGKEWPQGGVFLLQQVYKGEKEGVPSTKELFYDNRILQNVL